MQSGCSSLLVQTPCLFFCPFCIFISLLPGICESLSYLTQEEGLECDRHACGGLEGGARAHTYWRVQPSQGSRSSSLGPSFSPRFPPWLLNGGVICQLQGGPAKFSLRRRDRNQIDRRIQLCQSCSVRKVTTNLFQGNFLRLVQQTFFFLPSSNRALVNKEFYGFCLHSSSCQRFVYLQLRLSAKTRCLLEKQTHAILCQRTVSGQRRYFSFFQWHFSESLPCSQKFHVSHSRVEELCNRCLGSQVLGVETRAEGAVVRELFGLHGSPRGLITQGCHRGHQQDHAPSAWVWQRLDLRRIFFST